MILISAEKMENKSKKKNIRVKKILDKQRAKEKKN
jgi:hypothetical protein